MDKKPKFSRDNIYKNENKIGETLGEYYNSVMSHRMKDKNTFKTIFPSSDLWSPEILMKSSNEAMRPTSFYDEAQDKRHHFKMDANKRYNEEMAKAINLEKMKKNNALVDEKK